MSSTTAPSTSTNATRKKLLPVAVGSKGSASTLWPSIAAARSSTRYATWGSVRSRPVTGLSGSKRSHSTFIELARGFVTQTRVASTKVSPGFFSSVMRPMWSNFDRSSDPVLIFPTPLAVSKETFLSSFRRGSQDMATRLPAGSPQLLRQLNSAHVLGAIRTHGPISRAELAKTIGLSKPTVAEVVETLLRDGTVVESEANGERPARPGRRARLLRFRADLGHVLGIDIGANKVLVLLADLNGQVVASERRRIRSRDRARADSLLRQAQTAATAALRSAGVPRAQL